MADGHGSATRGPDHASAGAVRWLRSPGARLGLAVAALAAALAASSLLLAGSATRSASATTKPQAISLALAAPDGRLIVVPYAGGGCVQGATLEAAETGSTVTLWLREVLSGSSVCPADLIVGLTVSVTLRHPLWGRSLIDGSTGRPITYFDGRKLLRVTYLPPGYRFSAYLPFPSLAFTAWEREFISPGQAAAPVDVGQGPGNATVWPSWPVAARLRVGSRLGSLGVLTGGGQVVGRAISWRADGYTFVVYTVMVRTGQRLASATELADIARGLRL